MATEIKQHRILRMQDLPDRIGFRPSTIYELIAKGKFPRPFKLSPGEEQLDGSKLRSMIGSRHEMTTANTRAKSSHQIHLDKIG